MIIIRKDWNFLWVDTQKREISRVCLLTTIKKKKVYLSLQACKLQEECGF